MLQLYLTYRHKRFQIVRIDVPVMSSFAYIRLQIACIISLKTHGHQIIVSILYFLLDFSHRPQFRYFCRHSPVCIRARHLPICLKLMGYFYSTFLYYPISCPNCMVNLLVRKFFVKTKRYNYIRQSLFVVTLRQSVLFKGPVYTRPERSQTGTILFRSQYQLKFMGVPGGPPQFVGQKAVGQYSLHSRAILAYYKNKWDKFCQFCGKFCQFCGQFCDVGKFV